MTQDETHSIVWHFAVVGCETGAAQWNPRSFPHNDGSRGAWGLSLVDESLVCISSLCSPQGRGPGQSGRASRHR